MTAACVYFGGFHTQQRLGDKPNALSCWLNRWDPDRVAINTRLSDAETLEARWRRFKATHLCLWKEPDRLHVLAYSIGCHLAPKQARFPRLASKVS
jgi:hypothetical protein